MDDFLKFLKVMGVLALVLGIGALVGWFGTRSSDSATTAGTNSPSALRQTNPASTSSAKSSASANSGKAISQATIVPFTAAPPSGTSLNIITNWEERLDEILAEEKTESEKAKQLLEMFPHLPEDGQVEIAQHLANLTEDADYPALGSFLTNSALSEDVLDVLLSDLLNRPNSMKLPTLISVAKDSKNPKATEAKDLLELFLEDDYGDNWKLWQQKTEQWLKENPD